MGIESVVKAYRQYKYQDIEYRIQQSVGRASIPIIGDVVTSVKRMGLKMWLPFKMAGALALGGEYPVDGVTKAEIPEDVAKQPYGQALVKTRELGRQTGDVLAESWGEFFRGNFTKSFRMARSARYNEEQRRRVILPDESSPLPEAVMGVAGAMAASHVAGQYIGADTLGSLSSPVTETLGSVAGSLIRPGM